LNDLERRNGRYFALFYRYFFIIRPSHRRGSIANTLRPQMLNIFLTLCFPKNVAGHFTAFHKISVQSLFSALSWPRVCLMCNFEHVYSHKAAQKKEKTAQKTAIYSLAYIYIKQVVHHINS